MHLLYPNAVDVVSSSAFRVNFFIQGQQIALTSSYSSTYFWSYLTKFLHIVSQQLALNIHEHSPSFFFEFYPDHIHLPEYLHSITFNTNLILKQNEHMYE